LIFIGKSDPYAKIVLYDKNNKLLIPDKNTKNYQTNVIDSELNPKWFIDKNKTQLWKFEDFHDLIDEINKIVIEVWDKDPLKSDDFLGKQKLNH
jgi:hypothetical protein